MRPLASLQAAYPPFLRRLHPAPERMRLVRLLLDAVPLGLPLVGSTYTRKRFKDKRNVSGRRRVLRLRRLRARDLRRTRAPYKSRNSRRCLCRHPEAHC